MIVQPDFLDHWKTRLLVDLTGDPTAPLAVIRLWGFCQTSKRSFFPDMTPAQLASIVHWGDRKPACSTALVKAGFVEKLSPKGFTVHEWSEYNSKLLANWENGKKGGRPTKEENANENGQIEKPVGFGGLTQTKPIDRTGLDGLEQIEQKDRTGLDRTGDRPVQTAAAGGSGPGPVFSKVGSSPGPGLVQDLTAGLARQATSGCYPEGGEPTLQEVKQRMESRVRGSGQYAEKWLTTIRNRGWKDHNGKPVMNWKPLADSWADGCVRRDLGVTSSQQQKPISQMTHKEILAQVS